MPARVCAAAIALALAGAAFAEMDWDAFLRTGKALYSQNREEVIVRHFFRDRREGVYLDVGAYHWKQHSTTYYLEHHLGWSGIAIDALPWLAEDYRKNRPRARFFNYIVTDHSGTIESFYAAGPISSTDPDWTKRFGDQIQKQEIRVPTITLDELLAEAGVTKVDFVSMDIEGGEPKALAGFDLAHFQPELVCIGAYAADKRAALRAWFEPRGYRMLDRYSDHDPVNVYFGRQSP